MTVTHRLLVLVCVSFLALAAGPSHAQQQDLRSTLFVDADRALAAARAANAELLAPATFGRALDEYMAADSDLTRGRNLERIKASLATATKGFNNAAQAAEIASVTLAAVIKTRDDARKANAATFATDVWNDATQTFDSAARRLETGDIRGARSRADQAEGLYRDAELTAIKAQYLSQTRALLAEAEQQRVPRYAPTTYEKARSLLAQAERELNENRYDTDLPRSLAQQANYEARHAIYLAGVISQLRDEGGTLEDVILRYEEPLTQISAAADQVAQLDKGIEPVVTELVTYIEGLREQEAQSERDLADTRKRVGELEDEIRDLDQRLGGVSQERVALVQRLEAEARLREQFTSIENMFTRDEARVSREGNRMIIRLVGSHVPERPSRGATDVSVAAREGQARSGRVPALADRDRGPHGLLRQRREQPRAVAPACGSRQRVPDDGARRAGPAHQRGRLRRNTADRQQRHRAGPRAQPPHRRPSSSRSSNPHSNPRAFARSAETPSGSCVIAGSERCVRGHSRDRREYIPVGCAGAVRGADAPASAL